MPLPYHGHMESQNNKNPNKTRKPKILRKQYAKKKQKKIVLFSKFLVTIWATEWFITFYQRSSWTVYWQCGIFHGSSKIFCPSFYSRNVNRRMDDHQCGFFHVSSKYFCLSFYSHNVNSRMVYHQCESFHGSSNDMRKLFCIHTESS